MTRAVLLAAALAAAPGCLREEGPGAHRYWIESLRDPYTGAPGSGVTAWVSRPVTALDARELARVTFWTDAAEPDPELGAYQNVHAYTYSPSAGAWALEEFYDLGDPAREPGRTLRWSVEARLPRRGNDLRHLVVELQGRWRYLAAPSVGSRQCVMRADPGDCSSWEDAERAGHVRCLREDRGARPREVPCRLPSGAVLAPRVEIDLR